MARKNENDYFAMMKEMVECSLRTAAKLEDLLIHFHPERYAQSLLELHEIEQQGDQLKHLLVEKLVKEFITPIEREDIMSIAAQIDDVTDALEDVFIKLYMYNIQEILPHALEFIKIIINCCHALLKVFQHFANFKKSGEIQAAIIEINGQEELGDALYIKAVHELYTSNLHPLLVIGWTKVYDCLEKCCDTCENAADMVELVIMKNS